MEGAPTIIMAVVAFFCIADGPMDAKYLTPRQKEIAMARAVNKGSDINRGIHLRQVGYALLDVKNWLTCLMYFSCNVSFSSLPVFLPTILSEMGFSSINAQGLSAPPYILSYIVLLICSNLSDRVRNRGFFIFGLSFTGGIGYVVLATTSSTAARYTGVFLAAAGIFPSIALILPWVLNNQGNDSKKATGLAMLNLIGQCGPVLGTHLFPASQSPYYRPGMSVCAAFLFLVGILAMTLQTLLRIQNRRKDRAFGKIETPEGRELSLRAVAEDDPMFRYML